MAVTQEQARSTAETRVLQQIKIRLPFLPAHYCTYKTIVPDPDPEQPDQQVSRA
jgi:hypothetical protein